MFLPRIQVVSVPFAMVNSAVGSLSQSKDVWLGSLDSKFGAVWADLLVAMVSPFLRNKRKI